MILTLDLFERFLHGAMVAAVASEAASTLRRAWAEPRGIDFLSPHPWPYQVTSRPALAGMFVLVGLLGACGSAPPAKVVAPAPAESPLLAPMNKARQAVDQINADQEQRDKAIEKALQ